MKSKKSGGGTEERDSSRWGTGAARGKTTARSQGDWGPQASEERYRSFIENIRDGVYEVDLEGHFVYFNNALCNVFGYPREEIQNRHFSRFMDDEHARIAFDIFNRIYKTGEGFSDVIWEIIDREGNKRIIELSAHAIEDEDGRKVGFRGIARDVTERYKAQEALRESELLYQCQYEESRKAEGRYRRLLDFIPYPMVVSTSEGRVTYLNPAFTEVFGWTLNELKGRHIPYVPEGEKEKTRKSLEKLVKKKIIPRFETRRLTKDGRVLDIIIRGSVFQDGENDEEGQLVILRDVTQEKRMARVNEALLRISIALPAYPDLEDLLDYISVEIKKLLNVQGALVILHDKERNEFFFLGAAHDDQKTQKRAKKIRWPADKGVAGRVVRTGKEVIVPDTSKDPDFYSVVDDQLGIRTCNMLDVPVKSGDRMMGVLCAINKKEGAFDRSDVELLNMIAGTVALSIENARFSEEVKQAYREVRSLNRAKDKVINHLSHELKTPVSVLSASLNIIEKKLADLPKETWAKTLERAKRNLDRILEMQYQVEDIMRDRQYTVYRVLSAMVEACQDELEVLVSDEMGEGPIGEGSLIERIRKRIEDQFGPKESQRSELKLDAFVQDRLETLKPRFQHRDVEILTQLAPSSSICIPTDVLQKVVDGLIKNAVENTPDGGKIEIQVAGKGEGAELVVHDYGVGITEENKEHLFEGFFTTQDTMSYSSRRPFDFNAGGKGADLLRMKIFAERFRFRIDMTSTRCGFIPGEHDVCPGKISDCRFCEQKQDCHGSGETIFTLHFPRSPENGCGLTEEDPFLHISSEA